LTFSLLLNPTFLDIANQFDLNRVISLGMVDALEPLLGNDLKIKWPNDIYYGDKKLGGILIENIIQGAQLKHAIIGIGLNINQDIFPEVAGNAMSLKQILHKDYDLRTLLSDICSQIEAWYLKLRAGKKETVRIAYLDRLYWLNQQKQFRSNNSTFAGVITHVKNNGMLVVTNEEGTELQFSLKEIEFLNK
jgi:BirA family biotin operon repressor/biotin-[acetyl-CoA-carboxylase] ligase